MSIKKKIIIIIIGVLPLIVISIIGFILYQDYKNEQEISNQKQEIFYEIKELLPGTTMQDLASDHNCSIKDLTIEQLKSSLQDAKNYKEEQKQYDKIYKPKILEVREHCIQKIKNEILNEPLTDVIDNARISYYANELNCFNGIFVQLDTVNEKVIKIGMDIIYDGICTRETVNPYRKETYSARIGVSAELYVESDELCAYTIAGSATYYPSIYDVLDGEIVNWSILYPSDVPTATTISNSNEDYVYLYMKNEDVVNDEEKEDSINQNNNSIENSTDLDNNSIQNEQTEIYDKPVSNGTYTDKDYVEKEQGEGSYSVLIINNGEVEYNSEYITYKGTYIQEKNRLLITYTKAYGIMDDEVELDRFNDEFIIKNDDTLISSDSNIEFIKE